MGDVSTTPDDIILHPKTNKNAIRAVFPINLPFRTAQIRRYDASSSATSVT